MKLPFFNPLDITKPKLWPDYTLIIPVCAVGNVGQLACDVIISSLLSCQECKLIGRLYTPTLMTITGPNAFISKGPPTSSTEVYESEKNKLVIVQQRTSHFKELRNIYIEELVEWIKQSQFDKVFVLSSSFAQCDPDLSRIGSSNSISAITTSSFEPDVQWKALNLEVITHDQIKKIKRDGMTYLPGSGITKPLLKSFEKAFIRAAIIINFCSEGVNTRDCLEVVELIKKLCILNKLDTLEPLSWSYSP